MFLRSAKVAVNIDLSRYYAMSKRCIFYICLTAAVLMLSSCSANNFNSSVPKESWPDLDGNPYTTHEIVDGETYVYCDYSAVYETLDLSQYSDWGSFGEDGLMWVEKSDYTGREIGYIDYTGKIVIPFTSEIEQAGDFNAGYAIVIYDADIMRNGTYGIWDKEGNVVLKFINHAVSGHYYSDNGNIVLGAINLINDKYSSPKNYVFCSNSERTIEIQGCGVNNEGMYYSDGLLRTYRTEWFTNEKNQSDYKHVVTFYDANGEVALVIDCDSSEYYQQLMYVSNFVDGEAIVTFIGLDGNWYRVNIDKFGSWVNEPVQTSRDAVGGNYFG